MKAKLHSSSAVGHLPFVALLAPFILLAATPHALAQSGSYALSFNGTNEYVDLGSKAPVLGTNFTEEAWIFPQISDNDYHGILGFGADHSAPGYEWYREDKDRGPSLFVVSGTCLYGGFGDGTNWDCWQTGPVLNSNSWNQVAATYDGASYRVYVDGLQVLCANIGAAPCPSPVRDIGEAAGYYFPGQIDEVRIWNVALSQADILARMARPLTGTEPGLLAYYRFDEGSGITVYDATTNHINGALQANGQTWTNSTLEASWDWMSEHLNLLGNRALKALVLPSSHDSAMYAFDVNLLQFSAEWGILGNYNDWSFDDENLPDVVSSMTTALELAGYFGVDVGSVVGDITNEIASKASDLALTQDLPIMGQLAYGVRYFDLRPKFEDGNWYLYHGQDGINVFFGYPTWAPLIGLTLEEVSVTGPALDDVLSQVRDFVEYHRELVILEFSHYQEKNTYNNMFHGFDNDAYAQLVTHITNSLAPYLYCSLPAGQRLADVTLGQYLANTNHGTVLVLCDENSPSNYPSIFQTPGIWAYEGWGATSGWNTNASSLTLRVYDNYLDSTNYDEVRTDQLAKFGSYGSTTNGTDSCDLFGFAWGPANKGTTPVRDIAEQVNPLFADEMYHVVRPNPQGRIFNLISGDFVENSGVVGIALTLNDTPCPPTLGVPWLANQIQLTIGSVPGYQLELQQAADLNSAWTPVQTVTITNFPQQLAVPIPQGVRGFWRALVR